MMATELLFDVASPAAAAVGIMAGLGFFLVLVAIAYIAFRLLRRTTKMSFRLAVVAVILLVVAAGSMTILWFSKSKPPRPHTPATRSR